MHWSSAADATFPDADEISLLKCLKVEDVNSERSEKNEASTPNLRLLDSKARAVASNDVFQWTDDSTYFSKDVSCSEICREKFGESNLSLPLQISAK